MRDKTSRVPSLDNYNIIQKKCKHHYLFNTSSSSRTKVFMLLQQQTADSTGLSLWLRPHTTRKKCVYHYMCADLKSTANTKRFTESCSLSPPSLTLWKNLFRVMTFSFIYTLLVLRSCKYAYNGLGPNNFFFLRDLLNVLLLIFNKSVILKKFTLLKIIIISM